VAVLLRPHPAELFGLLGMAVLEAFGSRWSWQSGRRRDPNPAERGPDFTIAVTEEKGFAGGPAFTITPTDRVIKHLTIEDAEGKLGDLSKGLGTSTFSASGKPGVKTYFLSKPVKKMKVGITYWSKQEKLTVPVDLSVGVGL
jgi:hypothetical protein